MKLFEAGIDSERRALQAFVALAACVPVTAGMAGIVLGPSMLDDTVTNAAGTDSHFRYLSGILFAIGIAFWSLIPAVEKRGHSVRLLAFLVVTGGIGRLYGAGLIGAADYSVLFALAMELVVTPLLALWQFSLKRRWRGRPAPH